MISKIVYQFVDEAHTNYEALLSIGAMLLKYRTRAFSMTTLPAKCIRTLLLCTEGVRSYQVLLYLVWHTDNVTYPNLTSHTG